MYTYHFYKRPVYLGSSVAKSDEVVADFMRNFKKADIVVWVNPTSPLQTSDEIQSILASYVVLFT